MSGRRGGEAAKFGTRFEARWTVSQLIRVLEGSAISLLCEDEDALAEGAEFTLRRASGVEVHQTKLAGDGVASWTLAALGSRGVLGAAALHTQSGRDFHFVSPTPAPWLNALSDAARRSTDHEALARIHIQSRDARQQLDSAEEIFGGSEAAWAALRRIYASWPDENHLKLTNAALASLYLEGGEGALLTAGLADLVVDNLGLTLDAETIYRRAPTYGMKRSALLGPGSTLGEAVAATRDRWLRTATPTALKPAIVRSEARLIAGFLRDAPPVPRRVLVVAGAAGAGKSAVLAQVVDELEGWPVLATRVDRRNRFTTPEELGQQLGLTTSPVATLGAVAGDEPSLLLIDQLDAVSLASGRLPDELEPILDMIVEARAFPEMRVLLACRQYDLDNDPRLKELVSDAGGARLETVGPLDGGQIDAALRGLGIDPGRLQDEQRALLALPLNLVLLSTIHDQADSLDFRSTSDLLRAFCTRKESNAQIRAAPRAVRFWEVLTRLAQTMSQRQQLSVPAAVLDVEGYSNDARILQSEGVLVRDGDRVAFFHEALFDYAFAQAWVAGTDDLHDWLVAGDQELFRRTQVRQILMHVHDVEPRRFRREVRSCLADPAVRFHLKEVIIGVLAALRDPSFEDWTMVSALRESESGLADRLRTALWSEAWFLRADAAGALEAWLDSKDPQNITMALEIMRGGVANHGERVAEIVERIEPLDEYPRAVMWLARGSGQTPSRALFSRFLLLMLGGRISATDHDVFLTFFRIHEEHPDWACELLEAWLTCQLKSPPEHGGRFGVLESRDYGALQTIVGAATSAHDAFVRRLLPLALDVMKRAAIVTDYRPQPDHHFSYRDVDAEDRNVADALLHGLAAGLRLIGSADERSLIELIRPLLEADYDAAQWLAYQGLIGAGGAAAEFAADVLVERPGRLESGYATDPYWTTRELLLAINHRLDDRRFHQLEAAILGLAADHEYPGFTLLTGIDETRLSADGTTRLSQLRAKLGLEQPDPPPPMVQDASTTSPVPGEQAAQFDDDAWLTAMTEYQDDYDSSLEGGARELARVLEAQAKQEPERFARLGLRINSTYNPAYLLGIITGVADPDEKLETLDPIFDLVRHTATLDVAALEQWAAWPLNRLVNTPVPDDVVGLVLRLALGATSPEAAGLPAPGVNMIGQPVPPEGVPDLLAAGINTGRGQAASVLARLLAVDEDGHRTALVSDSLDELAGDRSLAVRACVAQVLVACMRHARERAIHAATVLLTADDVLMTSAPVQQLCFWLKDESVLRRMLASDLDEVREAGGQLAAYQALEYESPWLLEEAMAAGKPARRGAVEVCARRIAVAGDAALADLTVRAAFDDSEDEIRSAAAGVVAALRGTALRPHSDLLTAFIDSPTFEAALPQLEITLEAAPDRVTDLLAATVERFLDLFGAESTSIANAAAGSSHELGKLVLRWYEQADSPEERARALDVIDRMLQVGSFGVQDLVVAAER